MTARLIKETGGPIPGAIYIVDGTHACMAWSPWWRAPVADFERIDRLGKVGEGEPNGWSDRVQKAADHAAIAGLTNAWPSESNTVPFFFAPEDLGPIERGASAAVVAKRLDELGIIRQSHKN
jgi:hypothetical protein